MVVAIAHSNSIVVPTVDSNFTVAVTLFVTVVLLAFDFT